MPSSSSPAPPSPSDQLIPVGPKPKQEPPDISALDLVPEKQKKTRDLPNLSECHGCGRRINYSNPWERLQPLDSIWRLVLLCKKCKKQVNSGQLCPYCFKETSKSVSDCFSCGNCHHLVHKDCISKYEKSAPSGYSNGVGLEVTVCIDCWVPELLRRSIRVRGKRRDGKGLALRSIYSNLHCESSGKDNSVRRSLREVEERKVSFAVKAKKTALRKAVAARKMVESVNDALDLVVKKNDKGQEKLGLVGESRNGGSSSSDAELALQLGLAMNGSARIPKNVNFSCSDLSKTSEPFGVLTKSMDFKHNAKDGKIVGCSNTLENRMHSVNISLEQNRSCTFTGSAGLKPELFTYKRKNKKGKKLQQSCIETSRNNASTYSFELKPELFTYKRNRRKRKDSQQSDREAIEICTCSDSGVLKPELITYELNNRKGKECLPSAVLANRSCCTIEFSKLKSELLFFEHNDEKRKECQVFDQMANGSCTFVYSAMSKPELVTYKRNKRSRKEWQQTNVQAYENHDCNDSFGQTSQLFTYKRKNRKRKGSIDGSVEMNTHADVSNFVTISQSSLQVDKKGWVFSNDGRSSSPEGGIIDCGAEVRDSNSMAGICLSIDNERSSGGDDSTQDRNGNSYSRLFSVTYSRRKAASCSTLLDSNGKSDCDSCLRKYSRRIKRSGERLHKEPKSPHEETNTGCASIQTETELQTCCSEKHSILSEHSLEVNAKTCSCVVGSSQTNT